MFWNNLFLHLCVITIAGAEISPDLVLRLQEYLNDSDFVWLLKDLTKRIIEDSDCLTIITDKFYNSLFKADVFKDISVIPMFKILVKENEDLLAPDYKTVSVIQQARRRGCNTYIILIANGDETVRLLRFGDRHRVIDTRAKYILLYDSRLFQRKYVYLWKKIVNVLFIREIFKRFEFSTVPFPSPIVENLKPVWIDSWRSGKFQKNNNLFTDKTSNLNGEIIHVATFEYMPSTIKKKSETQLMYYDDDEDIRETSIEYNGLEIQILNSLSDAMKFEAKVYEPADSDKEAWGRKQLNGSYTGLLGEMVSGRADIALGNFLYTPNNLNILDLSIPYTTQCFTFLTPESTTDNSWKTLILPFKSSMWLGVLVTLWVCSLVFYGLANFHKYLEEENMPLKELNMKHSFWKDLFKLWHDKKHVMKKRLSKTFDEETSTGLHIFGDIDSSVMNAYSMLLLVSLPKMPTGWSLRTFTGCWWLYCILVTVAYRASMTAILANPAQRVTIDTLDELAASSIGCGGWGEQNKEFFTTSLDSAGQRVGRKFEVNYNASEAISKVSKGNFAYYENIYFLHNAKAKQKVDDSYTGINSTTSTMKEEKDLHIMHDCVINMPISLGLQKNSPLKPGVDKFLQRVIEAGLVKKWLADTMLNTTVAESPIKKTGLKALMDLPKFVGALVALGVGCSLGTVALLLENIHWIYFVKKDPLFDKYNKSDYFCRKKTKLKTIKSKWIPCK